MSSSFVASFAEAARLLDELRADKATLEQLDQLADLLADTFKRGNKILVCGNGGSMADAMHFAEEWTGRFREDRAPYPVISLSDPTHMSCTANDYGFDQVFERYVQAFGKPGDLCFLLTTSGESRNLVNAATKAKELGLRTIGFLGKGGGRLLPLCDWTWVAPGATSDRIQELHMMALHVLIEVTEEKLSG